MIPNRRFLDTSQAFIDSAGAGVYNKPAKMGGDPYFAWEGLNMKRVISALLALCLLAMGASALAATSLTDVTMLYEDYDDNHATQSITDEATLKELEAMLQRAKKSPAELENCTMNCTLLCTAKDGTVVDLAVATDGCPYITDRGTDKTYRLTDEDQARLWEIFYLIQETIVT